MIIADTIIGSISSLIKTWLTGRNEKAKAKQDMERAAYENKARLLRDKETNNHSWEMASITDADKWLRRISFGMFASPFLVAIFAPQHVAQYFSVAINTVPVWWQKTYMAITGGVWGISSLKDSVVGIASQLFKKNT